MMDKDFREVFENPGSEYRGTPFWSWNTKLDPANIEEQIQQFSDMGMGGFYMHTRVGLDTEYLGKDYMQYVREAVTTAKEKKLYACLYDEDRWPSGYAGGKVTARREYRSRNLLITPFRQGTKCYTERNSDSMASPSPQGNGRFLSAYYVELDVDGTLKHYERCDEKSPDIDGAKKWYVYLEIAHDSPWFNNQSYVDTLNPDAVKCFISETHEKYRSEIGEEFGKTIPSVFTDEPQFGRKRCLGRADSSEEVMLPFTEDFTETYFNEYKEDFLDYVPELLWELPSGKFSKHRYYYHDHVSKRFACAFSDQVGQWCKEHGLLLAGHMMEEPTLQSQTQALGEVMRSLRGFSLPGIDMLCDAREYTTAKQAQSICHQYGRSGMVSELYGVTNWDFDFRRHKLQGDWQAALGVTHRVHHLNWMSMGGEAKRDYPAAIGFQSPWYKKYKIIEDHFARINVAMRKGNPAVKIGVIHPVESCWLLFGPNEQTSILRNELDERFRDITEWLLFGMLDFDYISESLLPEQWENQRIGEMEYEVVIVPGCLTLRKTTVNILREMKAAGKEIIFMGKPAEYVDAVKNELVEEFSKSCTNIEFSKAELLTALSPYRMIDIRYYGDKHLKKPNHKKNWNGERTEKYIYQMRKDNDTYWVLVANGRKPGNPDLVLPDDICIEFGGKWEITEWDTVSGRERKRSVRYENEKTYLNCRLYEQDSLLLLLEPAADTMYENDLTVKTDPDIWEKTDLYQCPVTVELQEPNVLVLDQPEFDFDGRGFQKSEEILRTDNLLRTQCGYPLRCAALAQPWVQKENQQRKNIRLKYTVFCEEPLENLYFAMECMDCAQIYLDGERVQQRSSYYVDPAIQRVKLPSLGNGVHEIITDIEFSAKVNLESCYLLGDFYAEVQGNKAVLRKRRSDAFWGSITEQGMPFYGGNAAYKTEIYLEKGSYRLQISKFRAPLLSVSVNGKKVGDIYKSPYMISFDIRNPGKYQIEICSYGNRVNTFGAIHDCDEQEVYFDPNAWRTTDESWSYEYQLKKTGILKAPVLLRKIN